MSTVFCHFPSVRTALRSRPAIILFWLTVVAVCSVVVSPRLLYAGDAAIEEIVVTNSTTDLLLYCSVMNSFTAEMEKGSETGSR